MKIGISANSESGESRISPVHMKFPKTEPVCSKDTFIINFCKDIWSTRGRWRTVQIRREYAAKVRVYSEKIEVNHLCRITSDHLCTFECVNSGALIAGESRIILICAHVVRIRPYTELWIIGELIRRNKELVAIPRSRRIPRL